VPSLAAYSSAALQLRESGEKKPELSNQIASILFMMPLRKQALLLKLQVSDITKIPFI